MQLIAKWLLRGLLHQGPRVAETPHGDLQARHVHAGQMEIALGCNVLTVDKCSVGSRKGKYTINPSINHKSQVRI